MSDKPDFLGQPDPATQLDAADEAMIDSMFNIFDKLLQLMELQIKAGSDPATVLANGRKGVRTLRASYPPNFHHKKATP